MLMQLLEQRKLSLKDKKGSNTMEMNPTMKESIRNARQKEENWTKTEMMRGNMLIGKAYPNVKAL